MTHIKFTFILIPLLSSLIFAQSKITGQVVDRESKKPLPYANVFLSKTTLGSATDLDGTFIIDNVPNGSYKLVVQYLGYKLYMTSLQLVEKKSITLRITLIPKPIEGEEIIVELPIDKEWEKRYKEFEEQFLGKSKNAQESVILNPYSVKFDKDPIFSGYIASCDSFLIVENKSLGYRVEVILFQFRWNQYKCINQVLPKFTEITADNNSMHQKWQTNRKRTYQGSFKHFMSTIANYRGGKSNYNLFIIDELMKNGDTPYFPISIDYLYDFIADTMDLKCLTLDYNLVAEYKIGKKIVESEMIIRNKQKQLLFDSLGTVYGPTHLEFHGHWSQQRISDLLPDNYQPQIEK